MSAGVPSAAGLLAGFVADRAAGDPVRHHPVAAFGTLAECLEARFRRPTRAAGTIYVAALVGGAAVATRAVQGRLAGHAVGRAALGAATTWATLGGRSLEREAGALADLVAAGDLAGARRRAPALVGRDAAGLDAGELCRAAIESVAENTADAVVATLLWGAVAGPAGAVAYRAANTLDALVGHPTGRHRELGWAAARLDDGLTWPAAGLAALLAAALAPLVGGDAAAALAVLRADGHRHPSPNAGRLEASFAGALGLRLGGVNRYPDRVERRPTLGHGRTPGPADVVRAVALSRQIGRVAAAVFVVVAALR